MTEHDKMVLQIARRHLREGDNELFIGEKVISRKKIVNQLRTEFPRKNIDISGDADYSYKGKK